ncbi:MAG: HaeIII family restriction endonuclease [Chloracidobacterium sp.]|nr:HaeIII family restriction endonuclease [Chloracidobacterium sp.]
MTNKVTNYLTSTGGKRTQSLSLPVLTRSAFTLSREGLRRKTWATLGDYHSSVYVPILSAFRDELRRMEKAHGNIVAERLVQYLIGNKYFYKVIKGNNS